MKSITTEPKSETTQQKAGASIETKEPVAYPSISRDIKESALKNKDVVRMIIRERDSFQKDNFELKDKVKNLEDVEKDNILLNEKLKTSVSFEIFSTGSIAIGSLMASALFTKPIELKIAVPGVAFVIIGIVMKAIKIK